jgi:hypothetical protein
MSNKEDYNASIDAIMAIADEDVKYPGMPVPIYIQESENLYKWSLRDKPFLLAFGLSEAIIETILVRAGAFREAQANWIENRDSHREAEEEWANKVEGAYDFRDLLLHTFRYAFRNNEKLLARVSAIAEDYGDSDMIQDLNNLAVLGEKNKKQLIAINFELGQLETAATHSDTLATLLAAANDEKGIDKEVKIIRDRAYTYLKLAVDEVKNCGRFVFWKKPERLKGYHNKYQNKHRKRVNVTNE